MLFDPRERGQSMVEYALIILLVALVLILIVTLLGTQISQLYSEIVTSWPTD
jgi:pilus assembly protein Flp/PilA